MFKKIHLRWIAFCDWMKDPISVLAVFALLLSISAFLVALLKDCH